ncbi:MAG: ribosome maturation factor RimM [Actinomycetes bacterium]
MSVVVGRVGRAHGVRGDVSVEVRTDEPERRFFSGAGLDTDRGRLTVVSVRAHSGRLLLHFEGVDDRTAADQLRGLLLSAWVDPADRPEDADEFYDHQLVGATVCTVSGDRVGVVHEIVHLGGQDLLSVRTSSDRDVLIPFVEQLVPEVDLDARRVVIDPPDGLLDLGSGG